MAVNLVKGQKIDLRKDDGSDLTKVMVGLGWDPVQQKKSFFSLGQDIDCDASAFVCTDGKIAKSKDIVYFGHLKHSSKCIRHMGDNLTGEGEGDDEQIMINLADLPEQYDRVIIVVNIYRSKQRKQHFGMIQNAFVRIVDLDSGREMLRYSLSDNDNYDGRTAMVFGELYRHNGRWKFGAIGQGTDDDSVGDLAKRFS